MLNKTQIHTISFASHNVPFLPFQENFAKTMCVLWLCNCIPSPYNISVGEWWENAGQSLATAIPKENTH